MNPAERKAMRALCDLNEHEFEVKWNDGLPRTDCLKCDAVRPWFQVEMEQRAQTMFWAICCCGAKFSPQDTQPQAVKAWRQHILKGSCPRNEAALKAKPQSPRS